MEVVDNMEIMDGMERMDVRHGLNGCNGRSVGMDVMEGM